MLRPAGCGMADELEECKDRNRKLEEENELLRESAETFGNLADRLSERLREEQSADGPPSDTSEPEEQ